MFIYNMQVFIVFVNCYQEFMKNFSRIATLFTMMLKIFTKQILSK